MNKSTYMLVAGLCFMVLGIYKLNSNLILSASVWLVGSMMMDKLENK